MSQKVKIMFALGLFGAALSIWMVCGSDGRTGLTRVGGDEEAGAIEFARDLLRTARENDGRGFVGRSRDPEDPGLRESFHFLRKVEPAAEPRWRAARAKGDEMCYVHFTSEAKREILILLAGGGRQWKFIYATQE